MLSTLVTGVEPISNTIIDNITSPFSTHSLSFATSFSVLIAIWVWLGMVIGIEGRNYSLRQIIKVTSGTFISLFIVFSVALLWSSNSATNNLLTLEKIQDHYGVQLTAHEDHRVLNLEKGANKNIGPGRSIVNNQIWENVYIKQAKDGSFTLSIQSKEDETLLTPLTPVP